MERYLIHIKNEKYVPVNSRDILHQTRDLISGIDAHVRLARVATTFIEFDVAIETKDVQTLVKKLSPIGDLDNIRHVVEEEIEIDQGIKDGIFYFNSERFWECHEAFEGVWGMEGSTYKTVILASKYAVVKIINYSFTSDDTLKEIILTQTDTTMTTSIYNPRNGYTIGMSYTVIDKDTLQCVFTGDENSTVLLKRE